MLLGKHVPAAMNTRNNRKNVRRVNFCGVRVVSKGSLGVCSVNSFLQQGRIGGTVFYAVRIVSQGSK
jgi:hypothetical protein